MVVVPVVVGELPVLCVGDFGDGGAGGLLVDDGFAGGVCGDEGLEGEVVDGAGVAAGGGVDECGGVVAEQGVDLPRAFRTADLWLIHTADCCSRYSSWTCCGVRY